MPDDLDLDLRGTGLTGEPIKLPPSSPPVVPFLVVGLVIAAALGYLMWGRRGAPAAVVPAASPSAALKSSPAKPLGGEAEAIAVPPLDESDPLVRELVQKLSSHPRVAAWLTTNGLIRNVTVVVDNIADGRTPAGHLRPIRPVEGFRVLEQAGTQVIDPRSYERYNGLADAIASLDTAGTVALYATLKPRLEEAHREAGSPARTLDESLERAIVALLATPVPPDRVQVVPKGIGYGYADRRLESLTGAQKHLMRMGPRNVRIVQTKLRELALALGIPADRLPGSQ